MKVVAMNDLVLEPDDPRLDTLVTLLARRIYKESHDDRTSDSHHPHGGDYVCLHPTGCIAVVELLPDDRQPQLLSWLR